jgi:hypothetical protein
VLLLRVLLLLRVMCVTCLLCTCCTTATGLKPICSQIINIRICVNRISDEMASIFLRDKPISSERMLHKDDDRKGSVANISQGASRQEQLIVK